jgi:hypothetical protein
MMLCLLFLKTKKNLFSPLKIKNIYKTKLDTQAGLEGLLI